VANGPVVELISLPIPWKVIGSSRDAVIEIAVRQSRASDRFCTSTAVHDERVGLLLGFLTSGSLLGARELAQDSHALLYHKGENPYAAAAGGYALVGSSQRASEVEWHGWIRNMMNYFPQIPDGAIQWAQLLLRMRKSKSDVAQASDALKLAFNRGLPFYSIGMRWLLEGLEWFSSDDEEARHMHQQVRLIAWRTNYSQVFTTIRLGGDSRV